MKDKGSGLEALKLWVSIASSVAIPIVLGFIGYQIQSSISAAQVAKDYVQIAVQILREPVKPETEDLRQWAIAIMDKSSPVPLPAELKDQLRKRTINLSASATMNASGSGTLSVSGPAQLTSEDAK